jgi:sec-independent protein translocase protein TatB
VEFLGVGYQELLVIFGLLLVVVGPERFPAMAYQIGRAVRTMQQYARAVRDEFSDEIAYVEEQYKTVKGEIQPALQAVRDQQAELNTGLRDVTAPITEATSTAAAAFSGNVVPFAASSDSPAVPAASQPEPSAPEQPPLVF